MTNWSSLTTVALTKNEQQISYSFNQGSQFLRVLFNPDWNDWLENPQNRAYGLVIRLFSDNQILLPNNYFYTSRQHLIKQFNFTSVIPDTIGIRALYPKVILYSSVSVPSFNVNIDYSV